MPITMVNAEFHAGFPTLESERPFAAELQTLLFPQDNRPHVWFVKIPGVRDIDGVVWLPKIGLFTIEMKSWPLSAVLKISLSEFEIASYVKHSTRKSPWEQALDAAQQFLQRLQRDEKTYDALSRPWVTPVVALYRASRADFIERFPAVTESDADFKKRICESTVFEEDMQSGDYLIERLRRSRYNPVLGKSPNMDHRFVKTSKAVELLEAVLKPYLVATRPISAYDKERVRQLEHQSVSRLERVNWEQTIVCTGHIGTGKTFLGLNAALRRLQHPIASTERQDRGLFVCFNKVLAADIRRLVALSVKFRQVSIDVFDIYEFLKFLARRHGFPADTESSSPDRWAELVISHILTTSEVEPQKIVDLYQFVVVDEAQDLQDWAWPLLERLSDSGKHLFVIDGKNQLLYRVSKAAYLELLCEIARMDDAKGNYLEQRRVFRTTDTTFLVSQLFMEAYPDLNEAEEFWQEYLKPAYVRAKQSEKDKSAQPHLPSLELPRRGGFAPILVPLKPMPQEELILAVTECIRAGYNRTKEYYQEDQPSTMLVLVPYTVPPHDAPYPYNWAEIARSACRNLNLRFIDYTQDDERRRSPAGDEVRICTFHSSRGIEGLHSIVLGFNSLAEAAQEVEWMINNLGYITLSRSVYDTDVLYIEDDLCERREVTFLKGIMEIVGK